MKITEIITEVFNPETSFPIEWDDQHGPAEMRGRAYDRQGGFIDIKFIALRNDVVEVEFSRNDSYDMTGAGDANRVLATILEAFREYLRGYQPKIFVFSAKGGSRSRVYQSMIQRFAAGAGYKQFDTAKLSDKARKQLGHSGSDVMVLRRAAVEEAFDQPYKTKFKKSESGSYDSLVKLPDGSNLSIMFNNEGDDEWQVEFYRNNSQEVTGEGDAQRIFATVLAAIQKFIQKHQPWRIIFSASKDVDPGQNSESRAKLYDRLVQRYAASWGYDTYNEDHGDQVTYELTRLKHNVAENFADGKVKGKSRPGRVKRAGASCNGSVTDLRARAKNASGEKAKMYHWCANMKSGRKK
jgi:hypothetical protein